MTIKKNIIITCLVVFVVTFIIVLSLLTSTDYTSNTCYIGETAVNKDNVAFTVTNVQNTQQLGSGYLSENTDYNFVLITVKVTNNSNKNITISGSCADLYNSSGTKYESQTSLNVNYIISEDIGAGISKTFKIVFETPKTTSQETYILKIGYNSYTPSSQRVSIILKNK